MATETKTPKVRYDALIAHEYTVPDSGWQGLQSGNHPKYFGQWPSCVASVRA